MSNLTKEIVEKYSRKDSKLGSHLKILLQFSVVGFIETLGDMDRVRKVLDEEEIIYDCEPSKYLIWLDDDSITESLKKALKSKKK